MMFRKVASNLRIQTDNAGGQISINIRLGGGGRMAKTAQYMLAFKAISGANVRINALLNHGPDGERYTKHSDIIGTSASPVAVPAENLLVGDTTGGTGVLGEELELIITIRDSALTTPQWAMFDLYEMRKPF